MNETRATGAASTGFDLVASIKRASRKQGSEALRHCALIALAFVSAGCGGPRPPKELASTEESALSTVALDVDGSEYGTWLQAEWKAREELYRRQSVGTWHFKLEVGSEAGGFEFAAYDGDACGAFYRAPPFRLTIGSLRARQLMLFVTHDKCASATASRRLDVVPFVGEPTTVPTSFARVEQTFSSLLKESSAKAASSCQMQDSLPEVPFQPLQEVFAFDG